MQLTRVPLHAGASTRFTRENAVRLISSHPISGAK